MTDDHATKNGDVLGAFDAFTPAFNRCPAVVEFLLGVHAARDRWLHALECTPALGEGIDEGMSRSDEHLLLFALGTTHALSRAVTACDAALLAAPPRAAPTAATPRGWHRDLFR